MLTSKIFHLHESLPDARERLHKFGTWDASQSDSDAQCALLETQGISHFELKTAHGHAISADIKEIPSDDPDRILFRSVAGTLELAGLIELYEIRPNLTEAVLTLDYEPISPLQKAFDSLDRFLNRQLARIESCIAPAATAG
jgi:hypothetical protein